MRTAYDRVPHQKITANKTNARKFKMDTTGGMLSYLKNRKDQLDELRRYGLLKESILIEEVTITEKKLSNIQEAVQGSWNLNGSGNADQDHHLYGFD